MHEFLAAARRQSGRAARVTLWTAAATGLAVLGTGLLLRPAGISFSHLSRDPLSVAGAAFYAGALSNVFVLVWWSAAICCFVGAAVMRHLGERRQALFLALAGAITAVLTLDDLFQFHEEVVPLWMNLPEILVHLAYIAGKAIFIYVFRDLILRTEFLIMAGAAGFFLVSLTIDELVNKYVGKIPLEHLLEDGSKFIGIALWLVYYWRVSMGMVREALERRVQGARANGEHRPGGIPQRPGTGSPVTMISTR